MCDSAAAVNDVSETMTAGSSVLQYDPISDQYTYVWKTAKSEPAGKCIQLIIQLMDGATHKANFKFK